MMDKLITIGFKSGFLVAKIQKKLIQPGMVAWKICIESPDKKCLVPRHLHFQFIPRIDPSPEDIEVSERQFVFMIGVRL